MKNTHRLAARLAAITAAAAAVVSMTATGAQAATSFTPTGGPSVTFTGNSVSFTDIPAGQTLTCTVFNLSGTVVNSGVSRAYGANAGNLTTLTSSGCTNPIAGSTTVTPTGTWGVTITGDATGSVWPAKLTGVNVDVTAAGCSFDAAGTASGTFNDSTQVFDPQSGPSGLTISTTPVGLTCGLLGVELGDEIEVNGTWTASPALDISNP